MSLKPIALTAALLIIGGTWTGAVDAEQRAAGGGTEKPAAAGTGQATNEKGHVDQGTHDNNDSSKEAGVSGVVKSLLGEGVSEKLKAVIGNPAGHSDDHGALVR